MLKACDCVFIGLAVLFIVVLVYRAYNNKKEAFACGCAPKGDIQPFSNPSKVSFDRHEVLEQAYNNPWTNPDNKFPFMVAAGASPDGHRQSNPEEQANFNNELSVPCEGNGTEFFGLVEGMSEQEHDADAAASADGPNNAVFVGDSCLPPSMCADGCNDPTFEVYDRKIGQISKSRNYNAGDKIRGDLFICPARPTDAYGSDWFRPSNTSGVLNAGALRFIAAGGNNGFTNIQGDDIFNHGGKSANIDAQYASAECNY